MEFSYNWLNSKGSEGFQKCSILDVYTENGYRLGLAGIGEGQVLLGIGILAEGAYS